MSEEMGRIMQFVRRGQAAQAAVDEVIRSATEPEPEPDEDEAVDIREEFLNDHYWKTRNLLDEAVDADDDDDYRYAITQLREAIDQYPT